LRGKYTLFFLLSTSGMFHASTAFLPGTFAMYLTMLVFAAWLREQHLLAILYGIMCVILSCWPFVALVFLPLFVDALFVRYRSLQPIMHGVKCGVCVLLPVLLIDSWYYDKLVFPAANIVMYNVFGR
jgi:alpha-1,2-mannosyltransferase